MFPFPLNSVYRFIGVWQQESGKGPRLANGAACCVPDLTSQLKFVTPLDWVLRIILYSWSLCQPQQETRNPLVFMCYLHILQHVLDSELHAIGQYGWVFMERAGKGRVMVTKLKPYPPSQRVQPRRWSASAVAGPGGTFELRGHCSRQRRLIEHKRRLPVVAPPEIIAT